MERLLSKAELLIQVETLRQKIALLPDGVMLYSDIKKGKVGTLLSDDANVHYELDRSFVFSVSVGVHRVADAPEMSVA